MGARWTIFDAAKILEDPVGRLKDWHSRGFIPCSEPSTGQGIAAKFSKADLYGIGLFAYMVNKLKFDRNDASKVVMAWMRYFNAQGKGDGSIVIGPEPEAMAMELYATELVCVYGPDAKGGKSKLRIIDPIAIHMATDKNRFKNIGKKLAENVAGHAWDSVVVINASAIWKRINKKVKAVE